ncbi:hypothetical protein DCM91_06990 [Chitinophaga costaii]|nr:hypothetical protein DCM91_06990 [Chitinophaga costaii]
MDYKKYDPSYNPNDWEFIFRNNILTVNDNNINEFMIAIEIDKTQPDTFSGMNYILNFFIDFDNNFFVSSYDDIGIEQYVPDNWHSQYGDPTEYLPSQCKSLI